MAAVLVIDGRGTIHHENSGVLWSSLGCDAVPPKVLVRTMGYVTVELQHRLVRISLIPAIVQKQALGAMTSLLLRQPTERVVLSMPGTPCDVLCATREEALAKICGLMAEVHRERIDSFRAIEIDARQVPDGSPVAAVMSHWRTADKRIDIQQLLPVLGQAFEGRYLLVEHVADNDRLLIQSLGRGYSIFEKRWSKVATGEQVEDQYDAHYGRWASHWYRLAARRMSPLVQRIEAVIDKPRSGLGRERYVRVIVPFEAKGRTLLLSASTTDLASIRRLA